MTTGRLEAFSDGVIAIIITIMVLEFHAPAHAELADLIALSHSLPPYILSFVFVGIYWNNHHHLFHSVDHIDGGVLWANLHLLFWLSLTPLATAWMGEQGYASLPVAIYGVILFMAAVAYYILTLALLRVNGRDSRYGRALGSDFKGKISVAIYLVAILTAEAARFVSLGLYVVVALIWLVPDRRFAYHPSRKSQE